MSLFTVIPQGPFEVKVQKTVVPIIVWLGFDPFRPVHNHRPPCRRRIGGAVPRAEIFGDLITADHKVSQ